MVNKVSKISFKEILEGRITRQVYDGLLVFQSYKKEVSIDLKLPFRMDYLGVCLVRQGNMKLIINFEEHFLETNTIIFLSPAVIIQLLEVSDDIELCTIFLEFDALQEIGLPLYKAFSMENLDRDFGNFISLDQDQADRFYIYIKNIDNQNTMEQVSLFQEEIIKMTLMLLFYEINAIFSGNLAKALPGFERKNRLVMEFLHLISKSFKTHRSVQYYADQMFISRKHLSRVVKEVTGLRPKAILDEIVIAEAVILLNVSSMSVKDVMHELRFSDFGTFSKFFKNYMGKSPSVYRNEAVLKNRVL